MLTEARTIDALADDLRSLTSLDIERLFMRMSDAEARALFEGVFSDELRELAGLRDELETIEEAHEKEIIRLEEQIEDLEEEVETLAKKIEELESADD